jgi:hypothetical protein
MPKYKTRTVVLSKFKAQILIRSKDHFDFKKEKNSTGGAFINLLLHGIFSDFEGKNFFFHMENPSSRCEGNNIQHS